MDVIEKLPGGEVRVATRVLEYTEEDRNELDELAVALRWELRRHDFSARNHHVPHPAAGKSLAEITLKIFRITQRAIQRSHAT